MSFSLSLPCQIEIIKSLYNLVEDSSTYLQYETIRFIRISRLTSFSDFYCCSGQRIILVKNHCYQRNFNFHYMFIVLG